MLHRLMRVLDWVGFGAIVSSACVWLLAFLGILLGEGSIRDTVGLNWHNNTEAIIVAWFIPFIIYPALLILQYIVRDKVRILPWR